MFKKIITKTRIKILLVILVSFFVVRYGSPQVFFADTPKLNGDNIASLPIQMLVAIRNLNPFANQTDTFANSESVTPSANVIFKSISKGVYAGEDPTTGKSYLKIEAGTKYQIVGTVTINGKEYPKIEFVE